MKSQGKKKFDYYLDKSIVDKEGKPPKINTKGQFLVWKFCEDPHSTNWAKENKFAKTLLEKYPFDLWQRIEVKKKLYSLHWFSTKEGEEFVRKENLKSKLIFNPPATRTLQKNKVGKDRKIVKKKKTILELLTNNAQDEDGKDGKD